MDEQSQRIAARLANIKATADQATDGPARREAIARIRRCEHCLSVGADLDPEAENRLVYELDRAETLVCESPPRQVPVVVSHSPPAAYVLVAAALSHLVRLRGVLLGYRPTAYPALPLAAVMVEKLACTRIAHLLRYLRARH